MMIFDHHKGLSYEDASKEASRIIKGWDGSRVQDLSQNLESLCRVMKIHKPEDYKK